jgi:hypothetical protein
MASDAMRKIQAGPMVSRMESRMRGMICGRITLITTSAVLAPRV